MNSDHSGSLSMYSTEAEVFSDEQRERDNAAACVNKQRVCSLFTSLFTNESTSNLERMCGSP